MGTSGSGKASDLPFRARSAGELGTIAEERTVDLVERRARGALPRRGWLVRRMLLIADLAGLLLAFFAAQVLFPADTQLDRQGPLAETLLFIALLPGWIVVARLYRLYDRDEERTDHSTVDELVGVFHLVTVGSFLVLAATWFTSLANPPFPKVLTFWALAITLVALGRAWARAFCRRRVAYLQNAVIVGAGDVGQLIARKILQHPEYGINLVGFVDSEPKERREGLEHLTLLGDPIDLVSIVDEFDVERVIVAFSTESHQAHIDLIRSLKDRWVQVDLVPRLFEIVSSGAGIHSVEGLPLVSLPPFRLSTSSRILKRALDIAGSSLGLLVFAPLFAAIAIAIKVDTKGPALYRQLRMGAHGRQFSIRKFRTMAADAESKRAELEHLNEYRVRGQDATMFKVAGDPRVTRVGRFLRAHSLDELPQLVNVLKGDMSLVGPRPLVLDEDAQVADWARRRVDLRPGLTGVWQVLGRNNIPFKEMVRLDYMYVTTWSLWTDVRLLLRTIPLVVRGESRKY